MTSPRVRDPLADHARPHHGPREVVTRDSSRASWLREAGLSWRKVSTLRDLAARLADGRLSQEVLSSLPDDELIAELTAIPGIGPWTVQGAMIIALGREDVRRRRKEMVRVPPPDLSRSACRRSAKRHIDHPGRL
jgi:hypothetical protein